MSEVEMFIVGKSGYLLMFCTSDTCKVWSHTFNSVKKMQLACYRSKTTQSFANIFQHISMFKEHAIFLNYHCSINVVYCIESSLCYRSAYKMSLFTRKFEETALLPAKCVTWNLISKKKNARGRWCISSTSWNSSC